MNRKKTWFVKFPTYQYVENVKELAEKNNLQIVDDRFMNDKTALKYEADKVPTLTLKTEVKKKVQTIKKLKTKKASKKKKQD